MADDEFDIDIYGDATTDQDAAYKKDEDGDMKVDGFEGANKPEAMTTQLTETQDEDYVDVKAEKGGNHDNSNEGQLEHQQIKSTDESGQNGLNIPRQAPQQQGVKRKEGSDGRPIDPGATTALMISELNWWNTDDDIRGWVNQAQCEDELKDVTFSEHKVNGKSKGQAYLEFSSQQAATASKHKIDAFADGQQYAKKPTVTYSNPNVNPFKTLPKDAPARSGKDGQSNRTTPGGYNNSGGQGGQNNFGGNGSYRGRTPGYNASRGNMAMGGNFNRNFSGPPIGGMNGNFQAPMGGIQGGMGGNFGGFNRGGMMANMRGGGSMRGGRGGMNNGMMGGMPMGGMGGIGGMGGMGGMNGMGGPMSMGNMAGGMQGAGFGNAMPHFNPAFFQQNQAASGGGDGWQNPHGAKRPRPE